MKFKSIFILLVIFILVTGCSSNNSNVSTDELNSTDDSSNYTNEDPNTLTNSNNEDEFSVENTNAIINTPKTKIWFYGSQDGNFFEENDPGIYTNDYFHNIYVQENGEITNIYEPEDMDKIYFSELDGMSVEEVITSLEEGNLCGHPVNNANEEIESDEVILPTVLEASPIDDSEIELCYRKVNNEPSAGFFYIATSGYLYMGPHETRETLRVKDINKTGLKLDGFYSIVKEDDVINNSLYFTFLY